MSVKKISIISIYILFIFIVAASISYSAPVKVGESVKGDVLRDTSGKTYNFDNLIGRKVLVIWITNLSSVDLKGLDNFVESARSFSRGNVGFYMLSTAGKEKSLNFVKDHQVDIPVLLGGEDELTYSLVGDRGRGISPMNNFFVISRKGLLHGKAHIPGLSTNQINKMISAAALK